MKTETRKAVPMEETYGWLAARGRDGARRVERLSWGRLARIYYANLPGAAVRRLINAEARRLGYPTSYYRWSGSGNGPKSVETRVLDPVAKPNITT